MANRAILCSTHMRVHCPVFSLSVLLFLFFLRAAGRWLVGLPVLHARGSDGRYLRTLLLVCVIPV